MGMYATVPEGVGILWPLEADGTLLEHQLTQWLFELGSLDWCRREILVTPAGRVLRLRLRKSVFSKLVEGFDTLSLRRKLQKSSPAQDAEMLMREAWASMLSAPVRMDFSNLD